MGHRRAFWLAVILALCALALRCIDMTGRSLWMDESFSLLRVQGSWAEMFANIVVRQSLVTTDLNPPLYFALLKLWVGAAGDSDFALRLFSVFWSVLAVPPTYLLARKLQSRAAGILAAVFLLTCPATQWYGWEVRNYAIIEALGALNAYLALRLLDARDTARTGTRMALAIGWLLTALAGLFAHYTFAGFAAGQLLVLLVVAFARLRRVARPQLARGAGLILGALLALGAAVAVSVLGQSLIRAIEIHVLPSLRQPQGAWVNPFALFTEVAGAMQFGMSAADPSGGWLNLVLLLLALAGLVLQRRRVAVLGAAVLFSVLMWAALAFFIPNHPSFRYLIVTVPLLYVLAAGAVVALARRLARRSAPAGWAVGAAASLLVLAPHAHGLQQTFERKPTFEDDWRAWAQYLRDQWQPGDAVLINLFTPESVVRKYLKDLPVDVFSLIELDGKAVPGITTAADLKQRYRRIWLARTGTFYEEDRQRWLPDVPVVRSRLFPARTTIIQLDAHDYAPDLSSALKEGYTPSGSAAAAGMPVELLGWRLLPGNPYHQRSNVQLGVSWRRSAARGPWAEPLRLQIRVRVGERVLHTAELDAQLRDAPAAWGSDGAQVFTPRYVLPTPPGLPPLPYTLDVLVLAGAKAEVVQSASAPVPDDQRNCCLVLPGPATPDIWVGADMALARAEHPDVVRIGQTLPVVLSWRKLANEAMPWRTRLTLAPLIGPAEIATSEAETGGELPAPLAAWPLQAWVRDTHNLQLPYEVAPGWYRLVLTRSAPERPPDLVLLGLVRVEAYPPSPVPEGVTHPLNATAGDLTLLGLRMPRIERGATVNIATLWRVDRAPQRDGVLFLHVVNPDNTPGPQDDNPPERGARSTLSYRAGDGIDQNHRIVIPADAPPGEYRIYVGVYNRGDFERWAATQDGAPAQDNLILAATFTLD